MFELDCSAPLHPLALRGLELFNAGDYFEAHEALEDAWRDETGQIRVLYQAILQVAVTYLHVQHGNYDGAIKLYARCQLKLEQCPDLCRGVELAVLRRSLAAVMETVTRLGPERIHSFDESLFQPVKFTA
ncbi:MAG: DUF309 domain-containing protein [Chloroflexi bacterium]|nr:DUF309 domain-containing protein [Chloroflexota bacterium]